MNVGSVTSSPVTVAPVSQGASAPAAAVDSASDQFAAVVGDLLSSFDSGVGQVLDISA